MKLDSKVATSFLASITIAIGCLHCSVYLHETLLKYVFRWPMELFDTTPLGRLINRFAKDVDTVDIILPLNWRIVLSQAFMVMTYKHHQYLYLPKF